jgi:uncharacterized protein (TIGR00369 family)
LFLQIFKLQISNTECLLFGLKKIYRLQIFQRLSKIQWASILVLSGANLDPIIYGLLHGGASCVLAETLGSVASALVVDADKFICVGLEINANHIRSAREGFVTGITTPIHIGASTHVWDIKIYDEREKLVCVSRLTVAILKK